MNKKRPKTMLIRLSEEEYNQVKWDMEASGMAQQDWLTIGVITIFDYLNINKKGGSAAT